MPRPSHTASAVARATQNAKVAAFFASTSTDRNHMIGGQVVAGMWVALIARQRKRRITGRGGRRLHRARGLRPLRSLGPSATRVASSGPALERVLAGVRRRHQARDHRRRKRRLSRKPPAPGDQAMVASAWAAAEAVQGAAVPSSRQARLGTHWTAKAAVENTSLCAKSLEII